MEHIETVIIGAGQGGLAVGYHLSRLGRPAVILEAHPRVGDTWRTRWDSLRLFTPARFSSLPGMPFPMDRWAFPTGHEMADYLDTYANRFNLLVRTSARVQSVTRRDSGFVVDTGSDSYRATNVVVASGPHEEPRTPRFATDLDPSIRQLHSSAYRNPSQIQPGPVLIVGAGNSGTDLALELGRDHEVWLSGRHPGQLPFPIESRAAHVMIPIIFWAFRHVLTVRTPAGRRARTQVLAHSPPLIRNRLAGLDTAGVNRVPRVASVQDGRPVLEDGRVLDVHSVVWCTGFHNRPGWVDMPVFGTDGEPSQFRGVASKEPGLYFVGREFMYALSSAMIQGVGRDAEHVARQIAATSRTGAPAPA